ncbi:hypothetical protein [Burkholderia pyrrocinia]|uniref:hypothetical protein n=1 Tax=Burkholderia pyrrocinia TaxID=60550 RepID=UPI00130E67D8|nr:hypothetical protein [Burkholderia pyrrocinia]
MIGFVATIIPPGGRAGTRYVNGRERPVIPCRPATIGGGTLSAIHVTKESGKPKDNAA